MSRGAFAAGNSGTDRSNSLKEIGTADSKPLAHDTINCLSATTQLDCPATPRFGDATDFKPKWTQLLEDNHFLRRTEFRENDLLRILRAEFRIVLHDVLGQKGGLNSCRHSKPASDSD